MGIEEGATGLNVELPAVPRTTEDLALVLPLYLTGLCCGRRPVIFPSQSGAR